MSRNKTDYIQAFHDYDIYVPDRIVYIGSPDSDDENKEDIGINHKCAERAIKNLLFLDSCNKNEITVVLANQGGDVAFGMGIYDCIASLGSHVTIKVAGCAYSMAAYLLQSADTRLMYPNARLMFHLGEGVTSRKDRKSSGRKATAHDEYRWIESNKKMDRHFYSILLKRIKEKKPKFTLAQLKEQMQHDWILDAKEAVKWGLADGIIEE